MPTNKNIHITKLKNKAKTLHRRVRSNDEVALRRVAPYFRGISEFKLTQAQLVIARELHCSSWRKLISYDDWLQCSFCKKWQYEVKKLIEGSEAYVCDECIEFCYGIIQDDLNDVQGVQA